MSSTLLLALGAYALWVVASFYALWVCYVTVMSCRDKLEAGKFRTLDKLFGYPTLFVGFLIDFLVNVTVATFIYLEIPQETTLSERSLRHARAVVTRPDWLDRWRKCFALWLLGDIEWYDKKGGHTA
jgi:hypothetical protein